MHAKYEAVEESMESDGGEEDPVKDENPPEKPCPDVDKNTFYDVSSNLKSLFAAKVTFAVISPFIFLKIIRFCWNSVSKIFEMIGIPSWYCLWGTPCLERYHSQQKLPFFSRNFCRSLCRRKRMVESLNNSLLFYFPSIGNERV